MADAYLTQGGGFSLSGSNAPRHSCVDCGALVWPGSTRCRGCYGRTRNTPTETRCLSCLNLYVPKKSDRAIFCSRGCAFLDFALNGHPAKPDRHRWEDFYSGAGADHGVTCAICGTSINGGKHRRFCSKKCSLRMNLIVASGCDKPVRCAICGVEFCRIPGTWARDCSQECASKKKSKNRRAGKSLRKARIRGARTGPSFDPEQVLARDNWRCQICGVKTPKKLRGSSRLNAPELDHIVPVSRGGEHSIGNTQCLCRKCNLSKGARAFGQLSLPIHDTGI